MTRNLNHNNEKVTLKHFLNDGNSSLMTPLSICLATIAIILSDKIKPYDLADTISLIPLTLAGAIIYRLLSEMPEINKCSVDLWLVDNVLFFLFFLDITYFIRNTFLLLIPPFWLYIDPKFVMVFQIITIVLISSAGIVSLLIHNNKIQMNIFNFLNKRRN